MLCDVWREILTIRILMFGGWVLCDVCREILTIRILMFGGWMLCDVWNGMLTHVCFAPGNDYSVC